LDDIKQREIERLEDTDLDDVDLISETTKKKHKNPKPPHPLVPSLDFVKLRKIQEEEMNKIRILKNELDENIPFEEENNIKINDNDEDYEDATSLSSQYKPMFEEGSPIDSQSEEALLITQELMMRKAQVITQLNEIYSKESDDENAEESDESGLLLGE